jgi:methionyl-tRNA formyltransferase
MTTAARNKEDTRIVYMGTPWFSAWILEGLLQEGWNVAGVVTQPDRPRGRGRKVTPSPVKEAAEARRIRVLQPATVRDPTFLEELRGLGTDLIVTAAFGQILTSGLLALPPLGCFNVHFSLLPAYRGPAPVARALLNGDKETGITLFRMEEGTDTGPVLAAGSLVVDPEDTAGSLTERLAGLAREILPRTLDEIARGTARGSPQDASRATYAPMLRKDEGRIGWTQGAEEIRNRIRGLNPWPGAFTFWQGKRLRLWKAGLGPEEAGGAPGELVHVSAQGIGVRTGRGVLVVRSVQMEGKNRVDVADFLCGHRVEVHDRFDENP